MSKGGSPAISFLAFVVIAVLAAISEPLGLLAAIVMLIAWVWNRPAKY